MALAFGTVRLVIGLRPRAALAAVVGPLAWHCRLCGSAKRAGVVTDFCKEPRRQLGARSWQGAKKIVVGMTRKERFEQLRDSWLAVALKSARRGHSFAQTSTLIVDLPDELASRLEATSPSRSMPPAEVVRELVATLPPVAASERSAFAVLG